MDTFKLWGARIWNWCIDIWNGIVDLWERIKGVAEKFGFNWTFNLSKIDVQKKINIKELEKEIGEKNRKKAESAEIAQPKPPEQPLEPFPPPDIAPVKTEFPDVGEQKREDDAKLTEAVN